MPGNNGHVGGVGGYGETSIKISTSNGIVELVPSGLPVQKGKKLEFSGFKPGTDIPVIAVGFEIKNK